MAIATLQAIITKVRKLTVADDSDQLTDSDIIDYLNSFYLFDFPAEFRSLDLKDIYTFNTTMGIDTYPFDRNNFINLQNPAWVAKRNVQLFFDTQSFYNFNYYSSNHNQQFQQLTTSSTGFVQFITQAVNGVVTSNNHQLSTGNLVTFSNVQGMVEINSLTSAITVIDDNTFSLDSIDTTAFTPYLAGSVGDWVTNAFIGTLQNVPILRSINNNPAVQTPLSNNQVFPAGFPVTFPQANIDRIQNLLITVNIANGTTLNVTDDGYGNLIGDIGTGGNTVDYATGLVDVSFSQTLPAGAIILAEYNPLVLNMPVALLYYQDQIICRPVPDRGYTVEITAYRTPSQALMGTTNSASPNYGGVPELNEWWETLAVGTAKKVYEDRIDTDGVAIMDKMLQERYQLNYTRTYANLGKRRIQTIFSDQLDYTNNALPFGSGNP